MLLDVLGARQASKVFDIVIHRVAILMMNDFAFRDWAVFVLPHLYRTQLPAVMPEDFLVCHGEYDTNKADRKLGIAAGLAWLIGAEAMVVYMGRGISSGMEAAIAEAQAANLPIEYRLIEAQKSPAEAGPLSWDEV